MQPKINTPNKISLARFIGALVLFCLFSVTVYWPQGSYIIPETSLTVIDVVCFVLFIVLACTDALDGRIARKKALITDLGKFLDPLADKILVDGFLILLTVRDPLMLPPLFTVLFVARDLIVDGFRMVAASKNVVVPANAWGKGKTVLEMIYIPILLIRGWPFSFIDRWLDPAGFSQIWTKNPFDWSGQYAATIFALVIGSITLFISLLSGGIYLYQGRHLFTNAKTDQPQDGENGQ